MDVREMIRAHDSPPSAGRLPTLLATASACLMLPLTAMSGQLWSAPKQTATNAPEAAAGSASTSVDPAKAHLEAQRLLESSLASKSALLRSVQENDLQTFRSQVTTVREQLDTARLVMDYAFLKGAWQGAKYKRAAMGMVDRMQAARILSLMVVSVVTGYDQPTKKVPAAAADAAIRLLEQMELVVAEVQALNRSIV